MALTITSNFLKSKLKEVFGYNQFRGDQEKVITSILNRQNTFVIMPTGAGKSLCYQLPAVILDHTALVISPLIALMKNQVDQLNATGVVAHFLNSTLTKTETNRIKKEIKEGRVKLIYLAPESLIKEENIDFFREAKVSFIAVDEAHCISEWGHDFRPEYRKIRSIVEALDSPPIIALTATATPKVQQDILKNLLIEDSNIYTSSFLRPNLYYEVRSKKNLDKDLIRFVKEHKGKSGIIYCSSRKKVEDVANFLNVNDIKARPYHAGMDASERENNQDAFLNEEVNVIVATIAFGMGIDKPDVRFVVHYDAPKSLEGYYQETGRAGRDGLEGKCLMFYEYDDIQKLDKFNKDKPVTERDNARNLLQEVADFSESTICRPKQLLHYFGEEFLESKCNGMCDNCTKRTQRINVSEKEIVAMLEVCRLTGERFPLSHLVNVISGINDEYVISHNHNTLEQFGIGANREFKAWKTIARYLLVYNFLTRDIENIGTVRLTKKGADFIKSPFPLTIYADHDYENDAPTSSHADRDTIAAKSYDEALFEILKNERKKMAKEKGLPPYVIFQDLSLQEMATVYPTNAEELSQINGVGMGKVQKFGLPFIAIIKKYVEENDITTASEVLVKSSVNKSKIKIFIIQQVDRRIDLDEIAESKDISLEDLLEEIEHIIFSGTKLNLDYYINSVLEHDKQQEIIDYFMQAESDSIDDAFDYFDGDYSIEEIRLIRIKFLSEYGN